MGEQKTPQGYQHLVKFESWVSRRPQPTGKHLLTMLCIPEGCAHCRSDAEDHRARLDVRHARCADSSVILRLKSNDGDAVGGDSVILGWPSGNVEFPFDFREGFTSRAAEAHLNPDEPTVISIFKKGSELSQLISFYHP